MKNYRQLERNVLEWANDKGILENATPMTQAIKTLEEVGELIEATNNDAFYEVKDALGDILVTIIIGSKLNGLDLLECLDSAYNEIKDRKGSMVNGTFVKE